MSKWRIIGLTGPTGAGKGAVCALLSARGYGIVDTDTLAREVVKPGTACLAALVEVFSPAILQEDGSLNRAALAALAFASPEQTKRLNGITHPAIWALTEEHIERYRAAGYRGAVVDAPVLFESGMDAICDTVLAVLSDKERRLSRLIQRDNLPREAILQRMAAQPDAAFYEQKADAVVYNNGTFDDLKIQVDAYLARLEGAVTDGA